MRRALPLSLFSLSGLAMAVTLPYQGLLTDSKNNPVTDQKYTLDIKVYSSATGGDPLWAETQNPTTSKGLFSIDLGTKNPIPDALLKHDSLFLGLSVAGKPELTPRTRLGAVMRSILSTYADTAKFAHNALGLVDTARFRAELGGKADTASLTAGLGGKVDTANLTALRNQSVSKAGDEMNGDLVVGGGRFRLYPDITYGAIYGDQVATPGAANYTLAWKRDGTESWLRAGSKHFGIRAGDNAPVYNDGTTLRTVWHDGNLNPAYLRRAYSGTDAWTRPIAPGEIGAVDPQISGGPNSSHNSPYITFGSSPERVIQIVGDWQSDNLYFRKNNGTWGEWNTLYHNGNTYLDHFTQGSNASRTAYTESTFDVAKSGFYDANTASDAPIANTWTHLIHSAYSNDAGNAAGWGMQIAANFAGSVGNGENYYVRTKADGTYLPWRTLWHSENLTASTLPGGPYAPISTTRIGAGTYNQQDALPISSRNGNGVSFGRTYKAPDAPNQVDYINFIAMPEVTSDNYSASYIATSNTSHKAWIGRGGHSAAPSWDELWHTGNFDPASYLPLTGGAISGNLSVAGTINGKVVTNGISASSVADYVFEPEYRLAPLSEVEAYTKEHKHLPDIPSATEIEKGGLDLAQMNLLLLKKVEELTLHAIAQEKRLQAMEEQLKSLR